MISAPARSPSPAACVAASTLASTDSRSPRMMNQALPPIPRARCKSCSRTSAALQAASAERSAAATECSSTRPAGSSEAACARPAGPARTAGRICSCACGRKRRSMRQSPAAATPAATDSSVSPTPPAKSTRYLPGLTGPHWSSSTRARLATASATTTPRARDDTSSSASAGGEPAVGDEWLDNAELVLQGAAPLAGEGARGSEAVAGRAGDGPGRVALAAHAQPGVGGCVLDEERGVHRPRHLVQVVDALRMHHRRVEEAVLGAHRLADGDVHVLHPDHRQDRHEQLELHEGMRTVHLGEQDARVALDADAGRLGDLARVLADEVAVDVAVARHDRLLQPGQPRAVDL